MSEQNKTVARRLREECFSKGDMKLADELLDENYVYHGPSIMEEVKGREAFKQAVAGFRAALPDLRETVEDQIAEGDKVVSRFVSRGTHKGELMGAPPTGKPITIRGTDISRIRNGKIVEAWVMWDALAMLQQLGLVQGLGT
ncbi:MAG: ester cyclase [Acidobacteria bacterium]|nr:ester cyclase [Acidobacteriota bacterium]